MKRKNFKLFLIIMFLMSFFGLANNTSAETKDITGDPVENISETIDVQTDKTPNEELSIGEEQNIDYFSETNDLISEDENFKGETSTKEEQVPDENTNPSEKNETNTDEIEQSQSNDNESDLKVPSNEKSEDISPNSETIAPAAVVDEYTDAVSVYYEIQIDHSGYSIDTLPWGEPGFENAGKGTSSDYIGETVQVRNETPNGAYAEVYLNNEKLGWIDKKAFIGKPVRTYNQTVVYPGYSIDSLPWGTPGYQKIAMTDQYIGHNVKVVMQSRNESYGLIAIDDTTYGWVDLKAFANPSEQTTAMITGADYSIDTLPWGTPGYEKVGLTTDYFGETVTVISKSESGNYSLITQNDEILGWTDTKALETNPTQETRYIVSPGFSIDGRPWGVDGSKSMGIGTSSDYLNQEVSIYDVSSNGAYSFVKDTDGNALGWIDNKALSNPDKAVNALIVGADYSIDSRPWGEPGYTNLGSSTDYFGEQVTVVAENSNGHYSFVVQNGEMLGWIDTKALETNPIQETRYIVSPGFSIDGRPWGVDGSKSMGIGTTSDYLNQEVSIHDVSSNGAYSFVKDTDGNALGWIDNKALSNPDKAVNALIVGADYSIDSRPWGEPGYTNLGSSTDYFGEQVTVVAESSNGHYSFIVQNNDVLGWVDNVALRENPSEEKRYVLFPNYTIDGRPWGVDGSKSMGVGTSSDYLNQEVFIYDVSSNGAYSFVKDTDGNALGWIDNKALSNPDRAVNALIVGADYSIDSRPWGEPGYTNLGSSTDYFGEQVSVIAESSNGHYSFVVQNGEMLGWIDAKAVKRNPVKEKNYILFPNYTIDGRPWGVDGSKSMGVGTTSDYLNQEVSIYDVSSNGAYVFVKDADGNALGWIDHRAFGNMNGPTETISKAGYSLDSKPWGTPGYEKISASDLYIGSEVNVIAESSGGSYSAVALNGTFLGWLDNSAFSILIYLDPGHGGSQPGAVYYGVNEKDINLEVSLKVRDRLENQGYDVYMSRTTDEQMDLYDRPAEANAIGADILVSVHHNASGVYDSAANGIETYIYLPAAAYPPLPGNLPYHNDPVRMMESEELAESIHGELIANTGANDRGVLGSAFVVTREAHMPSVLLELGYMSNSTEISKLVENSYQNKLADAIVTGINDYYNR